MCIDSKVNGKHGGQERNTSNHLLDWTLLIKGFN